MGEDIYLVLTTRNGLVEGGDEKANAFRDLKEAQDYYEKRKARLVEIEKEELGGGSLSDEEIWELIKDSCDEFRFFPYLIEAELE
jgi:hypothetical protein